MPAKCKKTCELVPEFPCHSLPSTVLHTGVMHVDKVRELLKHGRYDVNCRDEIGWTPIHNACFGGHVDMVRMLISEFQADKTLQSPRGDTPLHRAVDCGRGEVALTLITEFGCDAMLWNAAGKTALHLALESGRSSIVRIFIKHVSVIATTKDGDTPLHIAAAGGHKECVEALLQLDAPIGMRQEKQHYILHIVRIFIKHVSVIATTKDGDTPLHIAAAGGHQECVEALLHLDAPIMLGMWQEKQQGI